MRSTEGAFLPQRSALNHRSLFNILWMHTIDRLLDHAAIFCCRFNELRPHLQPNAGLRAQPQLSERGISLHRAKELQGLPEEPPESRRTLHIHSPGLYELLNEVPGDHGTVKVLCWRGVEVGKGMEGENSPNY